MKHAKLLSFFINFIPTSRAQKYLREKYIITNNHCNFTIGEYSYSGAKFIAAPGTIIGKYCSIATGTIIGSDIHPLNYVTTSPRLISDYYDRGILERFPKIIIENDVWIGNNVIIPKSCTIGTGAVIGAGAVVTKDIPPYAVAVGIPARVIKYRFKPEFIDMLLYSKWWNLPNNVLKSLDFTDVQSFCKKVEEYRK